jgi:phosphatidylserine synthase 2
MKVHQEETKQRPLIKLHESHKKIDEESCFYQPHTLTLLFISVLALLYFAFFNTSESTTTNIKNGIFAAIAVFLLYCSLQLNDSFFVRPHRAVWRVVKGIAIIYLLFLVILLFQSPEYTRQFFTFFDENLGKPLPEKSYASDCRVYTPENNQSLFYNIKANVFDEFVIAHFLGWFGKALIFRDWYLSWFFSIWFEVLEKSLKHVLPNFAECWWDHIVLDILLCNGMGIWCAHKLLNYFEAQEFNWMGINNKNAPRTGLKRIFNKFMPKHWTKFEWDFLSSPRRFLGTILFLTLGSIIELNCFFLKFVLWHPPPHYLVITRLVIWWAISLPASREYYEFINNPNCKKLGTMAWLAFAIVSIETLLWIKCSPGQFLHVKGHPTLIVAVWSIGVVGLALFAFLHFVYFKQHKKTNGDKLKSN